MDDLDIAPRLKELRQRRKLSLREVGRQTGIAVSFLSALESGRNNVSVAKLKTILDALGTNLGEFFGQTPASPSKVVYRRDELVEISGQHKGISFKEVAAGRPQRALQVLVERYEPGCDTGPDAYRHEAEEAGVVLKGTLELTVDGQVHVLKPGDAYYFDSRRPHRFRNLGKVAVEAISVNTPPSF
ncbi:MAG: cupin domain-containing protein [Gemmataceae bacterium]|nr:cupin domain-containing protein [Gemmataceae bacterium]